MDKRSFIFFVFSLCAFCSFSQERTVGVFTNQETAHNGYTLFSPGVSHNTYLIDNCGHEINAWESNVNPGLSSYLLDDGSLLRTGRQTSMFSAGGSGGLLEIYNWDGDLTWSYLYSTDLYHQHHDVAPLPNGNILVIAWEAKSKEEAIQAGRDSLSLTDSGLWPDKIVEIKPIGVDSIEEVWSWHAWDHLIQDYDETKDNFGVVSEHPELVDINFAPRSGRDWMHTNSVEYIQERDEIILSVKHLNEIWVIDHSTTPEEARGHVGGNRGKGGDLLYRWGNPRSYQRGTRDNQKLFGQHAARWMPESDSLPGRIGVFNNGVGRGTYSSMDIIEPLYNEDDSYLMGPTGAYAPDSLTWEYIADPPESIFNSNQGGLSFTPDGNVLISNTNKGEFLEVNLQKEIVWKYVSPVNRAVIIQGDNATGNGAFRAERYDPGFIGFNGKDLTPGALIELEPWPENCTIFPHVVSNNNLSKIDDLLIVPTLTSSDINLTNYSSRNLLIQITDLGGRNIIRTSSDQINNKIDLSKIQPGIYFVRVVDQKTNAYLVQKIVKL